MCISFSLSPENFTRSGRPLLSLHPIPGTAPGTPWGSPDMWLKELLGSPAKPELPPTGSLIAPQIREDSRLMELQVRKARWQRRPQLPMKTNPYSVPREPTWPKARTQVTSQPGLDPRPSAELRSSPKGRSKTQLHFRGRNLDCGDNWVLG